MCGRYTLKTPVNALAEWFEIEEYPSSLTPSYNIAPTQEVAAVIAEDEKRKLEILR
jgi:putative SOS response-associated peptidase YedK